MSKARPVIGILACIKMLGEHPFHAVGAKYVDAVVNAAGGIPLLLPAIGDRQEIAAILPLLDGVLLTGSVSNVNPARYHKPLAQPDMLLDTARDATTFPLIEAVLAAGMPLLGICRGFQELNVAFGGSLHQHVHQQPGLMDHREKAGDLDVQYGSAHEIRLTADGVLHKLFGDINTAIVNSIHGQGIDRVGEGLIVEAIAPDGLVEAIRVANAQSFALAVQWHPEWKVVDNPQSVALFSAFGKACADYAAHK